MFRRSSSKNTKSPRKKRNNPSFDTATALIQATGIEKSFGTLKVLKGIDFSASDREVVSIVGASGAGKSTLLSILGSLSRPDAGKVLIDGTDIFALGEKQLAAFRRVTLSPGESREVELEVPYRSFGLWDANMHFGVEEGWFEVWLGRNANERITAGRVYVN